MSDALVWMDLEMTGLNPLKDKIIEIAVVITDNNLNLLDSGLNLVIYQTDSVLQHMNDWCKQHHAQSGLIDKIKASKITEQEAEAQVIKYIKQYVPINSSPLCGNSIHMDRSFLANHMQTLHDYFHYRNIDVSSIKELLQRWSKPDTVLFDKALNHRALDDVICSIDELKFYRDKGFFNINNVQK